MTITQTDGAYASGWPGGIGFFCLFLAALFQMLCVFQPFGFLMDVIFERDDAFYYFVIAQNTAKTGMATFDGLHLSNGVQLLWHYILVGLAYLVPEKIAFLRAVLVLCVALNVAAGVLIWTLGRRLHSVMLGDIALIFWAGIMIERWNTLQGMEFSLHIVIILAILLVLWRIWQAGTVRSGQAFLLGLLLTLNYWTRLDAVIFSIAIWVFAVFVIRAKAGSVATVLSLTAIPAIGALLYLWASYDMAETLLPLSGSIKRHYSALYFDGVDRSRSLIEQAGWWLKIQSMMMLGVVPETFVTLQNHISFNPKSEPLHAILPIVVFVLVGCGALWLWIRYGFKSAMGRIALAGCFLWALSALHIAVNVLALADFSHVTRHYYGWLLVFWLIWGATLVVSVMEGLPKGLQAGLTALFVGGAGLGYGASGYQFLVQYEPEVDNYAPVRMQLGTELSAELAPDAIVGAWNAGVLGYFLDRPVVNLDGLVNDKEFRDVLASGAPIQDYLEEVGVTHLVDHNKRDLTLAYQERRDVEAFFRNGITWDEVDALKQVGDIYVLKVKD